MLRSVAKNARQVRSVRVGAPLQAFRAVASPAAVQPARAPIVFQATRALSTAASVAPANVPLVTNPFIPLQNIDPHSIGIGEPAFVEFDNLVHLQQRSAAMFAEKPLFGVYQPDHTFKYITYKDFNVLVDHTRGMLGMLGVGIDDKVALICNNRVEWAAVMYGTMGRGGQLVPMYEAQKERDWRYIVEDSGAKVVVVATEPIYEIVKEFVGKVGNVTAVVCLDAPANAPHSYEGWLKRAQQAAQGGQPGSCYPAHIPSPSHLAALIYTSGTTGNPKGVELTHNNFASDIKGAQHVHSVTNVGPYNNLIAAYKARIDSNRGEDKYSVNLLSHNLSLCFLPWSHVFGLTCELNMLACFGGAMAIVPHRDLILQCLQAAKPTLIFSVPMLFNRVYDGVQKGILAMPPLKQKLVKAAFQAARQRNEALEFDRPVGYWTEWKFQLFDKIVLKSIRDRLGGKVRYMANGGAAAGMPVLQFFEDIGIPVADGYGLTETSPMLTVGGVGWGHRRIGCVGVALPSCDLRIIDPDTLQEMAGELDGEVVAAGPMIMRGYHNNEAANAECFFFRHAVTGQSLDYEAFHALPQCERTGFTRFFKTGDMGRMVEGKYLKITGRIKEQYKLLNGKYVVPSPLEDVFNRFPGIQQCLLYGNNQLFNVLLVVPNYAELKGHFSALSGAQYGAVVQAIDASVAAVAKSDADALALHSKVLFESEEFKRFVTEGIVRQSKGLKSFERPMKWAPLAAPFSAENQMLTPKMSLRRNNIRKAYEQVLHDLFDPKLSAGHQIDHGSAMINDF